MSHDATWSLASAAVLAEEDKFMQLGERFRESEAPLDLVEGLLLLGAVVLLGLVLWFLHRTIGPGRDRKRNSPGALFRQLCRVHRLNRSQRRTLRQLARYHRLDHPARLFVDITLFRAAVQEGQLPLAKLEPLCRRLFGQ